MTDIPEERINLLKKKKKECKLMFNVGIKLCETGRQVGFLSL